LSGIKPLVSIIILNYNAGELLLKCVKSILNTNYENFEVILVDNVSSDNSHRECKERFKQIRLIENKKNLGYCEGNNVGIRNAKGDYVIILNPDTTVEPNWVDEFLVAFGTYGEGLYQPKILSLYEKKILQSTGNMLHLFGFGFARDKGLLDTNNRNNIEQIGYASGTCLFTSMEVLDLGWRAAQTGIKSYYVPKAVIYHAESYTLKWSAKKFYWLERNRRYCLLTHYSKKTYAKMFPSLILVDILVWIFYLSKGFLGSKIRAELDILKNKDHVRKKYYELESKKIVPDIELIKTFSDSIFVPENVSGYTINKLFNALLVRLSKKAKFSILSN